MKKLFGGIKLAMQIEKIQTPEISQKTRPKTAVIVKQQKEYLEGNQFAAKFYDDLGKYLREKGYTVSFHSPESGTPPQADIWITHGGYNSPKGTKQILLAQYRRPFFTKGIREAIDKAVG